MIIAKRIKTNAMLVSHIPNVRAFDCFCLYAPNKFIAVSIPTMLI